MREVLCHLVPRRQVGEVVQRFIIFTACRVIQLHRNRLIVSLVRYAWLTIIASKCLTSTVKKKKKKKKKDPGILLLVVCCLLRVPATC